MGEYKTFPISTSDSQEVLKVHRNVTKEKEENIKFKPSN